MSDTQSTALDSSPAFDLVCIGFGPAQLATAIANREAQRPADILFLERKPCFTKSSGSRMSRTRMENAFLYDLATIRNPRSAFTYVNYLLARSRLVEFANSDRLNPLREEFDDYQAWCAENFHDQVRYGNEVVGLAPEKDGDVIKNWKVAVQDGFGKKYVVRAGSVVVPSPSKPISQTSGATTAVDFTGRQRIISVNEYTSRRNDLRDVHEPPLNVAVIGSSLRAAEIVDDLLSCPRLGNITVVTEDESLTPLQILSEKEPPEPRLCSLWTRPDNKQTASVTGASDLVRTIYMRAYEKKVASRGEYGLRIIMGRDAAEASSEAHFIIRDTTNDLSRTSAGLLQSLDTLIVGCRRKSDSLEEVQFKRGTVAESSRMWLMSAQSSSEGSLPKDLAVMAGQVVSALASPAEPAREGVVVVQARI